MTLQQFMLVLSLVASALFVSAKESKNDEIRNKYFEEKEDPCKWQSLYLSLNEMGLDNSALRAYRGANQAASAGCIDGVFKKLKMFNQGTDLIEKLVEKHPQNYEIRFIRYIVKFNAPSFLGYSDIRADKFFLLDTMKHYVNNEENTNIKNHIYYFKINYSDLNKNQINFVKELINIK